MTLFYSATNEQFDRIRRDARASRNFRRRFMRCMSSVDEVLVVPTSTDRIIQIFMTQGYWSGHAYNIHMCLSGKFIGTKRHFGE